MEEKEEIRVKYSAPTVYSKAPYKSICKVVLNYSNESPENYEYYIQTSIDDKHPYWENMGDFLVKTFESMLEREIFIDNCFDIINGTERADHLEKLLSK